LGPNDVALLLEHNFISKVDRSQVRGWMKVFSVVEIAKMRRRIICWSKVLNEVLRASGYSGSRMNLGSIHEHLHRLHDGSLGATMDLKLAYWQLPLSPEVANFFCFVAPNGEIYRFDVLPMGFVPAAEVQQGVTSLIASDRLPSDKYIDGIRFIGDSDEELDLAIEDTLERASFVGATFGDIVHPSTSYEWVGISFDHEKGTVSCTQRLIDKITASRDSIARWTVKDCMRAASLLRFASSILRAPLVKYYWALKFISRIAARDDLEAPARVWASAAASFARWFEFCVANLPVTPPRRDGTPSVVLFTDSTPTRWGAVLLAHDTFYVASAGFSQLPSSINVAETLAIAFAWSWAGPFLQGVDVALFVDNTSAQSAASKGYSRVLAVNMAAQEIVDVLAVFPPRSLAVRRVSSAANLADGPSRGVSSVDPELCRAVVRAAGLAVTTGSALTVSA
jgi:hypothetical protein